MNLKGSIAVALLGLVAGAGCSSDSTAPKAAAGAVVTTQTTAAAVSFASCADAQAAGYHDIARGAPGYSARLDGDGDGVACDQKPKESFDPQAYCVDKLKALAVKYPKSLGGANIAAECTKMLDKTGATSAKTIDALLETAETFYKPIG